MAKTDKTREYEQNRKAKHGNTSKAWTLVFYEDTWTEDEWSEYFEELQLPIWVSPLHDKDKWTKRDEEKNPAHKAGETKKPHRHLIVQFPHAIAVDRATSIFAEMFDGKHSPAWDKAVIDLDGLISYLWHDPHKWPKKYPYNPDDCVLFGGASIDDVLDGFGKPSERDLDKELVKMRRFIRLNGITEFFAFIDWCDSNHTDWAHLMNHYCAYIVARYIDSIESAVWRKAKNLQERYKRCGIIDIEYLKDMVLDTEYRSEDARIYPSYAVDAQGVWEEYWGRVGQGWYGGFLLGGRGRRRSEADETDPQDIVADDYLATDFEELGEKVEIAAQQPEPIKEFAIAE